MIDMKWWDDIALRIRLLERIERRGRYGQIRNHEMDAEERALDREANPTSGWHLHPVLRPAFEPWRVHAEEK